MRVAQAVAALAAAVPLRLLAMSPGVGAVPASEASAKGVVIPHDHPLIHFHGRWDSSPGTWWYGSLQTRTALR